MLWKVELKKRCCASKKSRLNCAPRCAAPLVKLVDTGDLKSSAFIAYRFESGAEHQGAIIRQLLDLKGNFMASAKTQTAFSFEGKTVEELLAFQQQLLEAVEAKKEETRETDLAEVLRLVEFHGFTAEDLGLEVHEAPAKRGRKPGSASKTMKREAGTTYKHPEHGTYSGRGRPPAWFTEAKKAGTLEQYTVKPAAPEGEGSAE